MQHENDTHQTETQNPANETQPDTQDNPDTQENETLEAPSLQEEIEKLSNQVTVLSDQIVRERAENDNLRKRQERELQGAYKFATERLIKDLIPVLDSLYLGIEAARNNDHNTPAIEQFIEGSEMTLKLMRETLNKHGVEELHPEGEKFNPDLHEAVTALPNAEVAPNTVLHVTQKGYTLNGRVIRAAQVVIAKNQ